MDEFVCTHVNKPEVIFIRKASGAGMAAPESPGPLFSLLPIVLAARRVSSECSVAAGSPAIVSGLQAGRTGIEYERGSFQLILSLLRCCLGNFTQ